MESTCSSNIFIDDNQSWLFDDEFIEHEEKEEFEFRFSIDDESVFIKENDEERRYEIIRQLEFLEEESIDLLKENYNLEISLLEYLKKTYQRQKRLHANQRILDNYDKILFDYKIIRDDIDFEKSSIVQLVNELDEKSSGLIDKEIQNFENLQDVERKCGSLGLIYSKSGKKLGQAMVNEILRRQIGQKKIVQNARRDFIHYENILERLKLKLKNLETLGPGMSILDYELLLVTNNRYKDKLDMQKRDSIKIKSRIDLARIGLSHCGMEKENLELKTRKKMIESNESNERLDEIRTNVNNLKLNLIKLRRNCWKRKKDAGLLFSQSVLLEMEKTLKKCEAMKEEIQDLMCIPNGGRFETDSTMTTDLQPSSPNYRIRDEANAFQHHHHHHHHHRRRRQAIPSELKLEPHYGESFSLALTERDESSPPPTPPVRDASSLKSVCYGPGHEKYPSWPSAPEPTTASTKTNNSSHRSKSWTEHTNYPKEKPASYTRPHPKRSFNPSFTQQLKTVMERCEKIPAETFQSKLWPLRTTRSSGDYHLLPSSPPERETTTNPTNDASFSSFSSSSSSQEFYFDEYNQQFGGGGGGSYAQSEGYHSYVSSLDSSSTNNTTVTPFLDRLRRDSEAIVKTTTTTNNSCWEDTASSGSVSSSETLKWHGSISDVSENKWQSSMNDRNKQLNNKKQLIVHSARVKTPQRQQSESIVCRKKHSDGNFVAERILEFEKEQQQTRYTYLDPDKRHRVSDPTLKAIQKKALLSFYERHHQSTTSSSSCWRSEPHLLTTSPPKPPPRIYTNNVSGRRASSASDYATRTWKREEGPVILGPSISIDDWVPERPPKKPYLRPTIEENNRVPSPDLPPPSPPNVDELEVRETDEPLPPPPPLSELLLVGGGKSTSRIFHEKMRASPQVPVPVSRRRSFERRESTGQIAQGQVPKARIGGNVSLTASSSPPPPLVPRGGSFGWRKDPGVVIRSWIRQGHQDRPSSSFSPSYRREKGAPDNGGSYRRTISPTSITPSPPTPTTNNNNYDSDFLDKGRRKSFVLSSSPPRTVELFIEKNVKVENEKEEEIENNNHTPLLVSKISHLDRDEVEEEIFESPELEIKDELELIERTEMVLRINNTRTNDACSQTDLTTIIVDENHDDENKESLGKKKCRKILVEEIECEELSRDLISRLGPNDKLRPILVPTPEYKRPSDYVDNLFRLDNFENERYEKPTTTCDNGTTDDEVSHKTIIECEMNSLSTNTPYLLKSYNTDSKLPRFHNRYSQDVEVTHDLMENFKDPSSGADLSKKKEELIIRLDKKLVVLKAEQEAINEEIQLNESIGARLANRIITEGLSTESSKYRVHVEEVGKITSLLVGLSGRLARIENTLFEMSPDHPEKKTFESKRDKLIDQLEEAKILKRNIDKRSIHVAAILAKYFNDEEFTDYEHYINTKAKLIVDVREIRDKIKLGEEQLAALREAIVD